MPLPNENTSMVNRLCHASLEHECLKTALKEVLHSQSQNIIKFVLALIQKSIPIHLTLKDKLRIFLAALRM